VVEVEYSLIMPGPLTPTSWETLWLPSGREVHIPKATPSFRRFEGEFAGSDWGNKPILDFEGVPLFAELVVWRLFEREGWSGGWMSGTTRYRTQMPSESKTIYALPDPQRQLLDDIYNRAGVRRGRADVYCWKGEAIAFAEVKHRDNDQISPDQRAWIEAALRVGVPLASLLIVEWEFDG
jgi:hypothetical protein